MSIPVLGKGRAGTVLDAIIKENCPELYGKIYELISNYHYGILMINKMPSALKQEDKTKKHLAEMWRKEYLNKINFHYKTDTYIKNVIDADYKYYFPKSKFNKKANK